MKIKRKQRLNWQQKALYIIMLGITERKALSKLIDSVSHLT